MPIGIDIEKAKEIHKEHIRAIRKPILEQKDVEYMRALEMGDQEKVAQVVTEKQELRDVTKIVTDAEISGTTVSEVTAELKQIWNEEILGTNPLV
jgi:tRNA 2-selenouridine synthase SelU